MGEFKEYHQDVAASHSRPPTVSLMSNGAIYLSPTAMDVLEWPDYVRLRFNEDEDIVEISPATEDTLHPLPCVTDGIRGAHKHTGRGRTIYARAFFDAINRKPLRAQAIATDCSESGAVKFKLPDRYRP